MSSSARLGLLAAAAVLGACDSAARLRTWVRSEPVVLVETELDRQGTALTVQVTPPEGITIWVDDVKAATASPHHQADLAPGRHILLVRGMGFYPVTLPFTLRATEPLTLPVSLRPRPTMAAPAAVAPLPLAATAARPPAPPPLPRPLPLPAGVEPIELQFFTQPTLPVSVDGIPCHGGRLLLAHGRGNLVAGPLRLAYSIDAEGLLQLILPAAEEGLAAVGWTQDAQAVTGGHILQLSHGSTRLSRQSGDGATCSLILRRAD